MNLPEEIHDPLRPSRPLLDYRPETLREDRSTYLASTHSKGAPGQLAEYWQMLRRHTWLVVATTALGILTAAFLWVLTPRMYQARVSLDVKESGDSLPVLKVSGSTGNYPPEGNLQTEIKILQSQSLMARVVDKVKRGHRYWDQGQRTVFGHTLPRASVSWDEAVMEASKKITVRPLGATRIVEVLCDARDPHLASVFCNTLADEYIQQNLESRSRVALETGDWLRGYVDTVKRRLTRSEGELQSSATAAALLFNTNSDSLAQDKLRQVQNELSRAQSERMIKQSQYEMAKNNPAESLPLVLDNESLTSYQTRISDLKRQLAEASVTRTPVHLRVREIEAQIKQQEETLESQRAEIVKRMRNEFESAERREGLLTKAYEEQVQIVTNEAGRSVQHNMLTREVDSGRKIYETMLEKVEEVGLASAMRASMIRVLDPASPPSFPVAPNAQRYSASGCIAGLTLGIAFAFVRSRSDKSLQGPGDTPLQLNVRELGAVPAVGRGMFGGHLGRLGARSRGSFTSLRTVETLDSHGKLELITWHDKSSMMAECISAIMSSILFNGGSRINSEVLVVTSPESGDGKTTVVSNLAIALAEIGHRVLLIDGDLRRPRLHTVFGVSNNSGLLDALQDKRPAKDLPLSEFIVPTLIANLSVMPSGSVVASPSNLLHSDRLGEVFSNARKQFDLILVDTPPMGLISDARVISRFAKGVLLVFRAQRTTKELAVSSQQRFIEDGTPVLGTILNNWNFEKAPGYGEYRNHSRYLRS